MAVNGCFEADTGEHGLLINCYVYKHLTNFGKDGICRKYQKHLKKVLHSIQKPRVSKVRIDKKKQILLDVFLVYIGTVFKGI